MSSGPEHLFLNGSFMLQQKIHTPVKMLNLNRLLDIKMYILCRPFFHRQFGGWIQCPVSHHGKDGILHRRGEVSILQGFG